MQTNEGEGLQPRSEVCLRAKPKKDQAEDGPLGSQGLDKGSQEKSGSGVNKVAKK